MGQDYTSKEKIQDIMNTTQNNYSNMLKRLQGKKVFSNFVITYYSICLIVYSLTAEFYPKNFDTKLSSYFNIILSVVVLTYSLIVSNAKYSERLQSAERVLNEIKAKKREVTQANVKQKMEEYDIIMMKAEYRSELDFFRTIKQKCKEKDVRWYRYKKDLERHWDEDGKKLNNYLSENFPFTQQMKIMLQYLWDGVIILAPIVLFLLCFWVKMFGKGTGENVILELSICKLYNLY